MEALNRGLSGARHFFDSFTKKICAAALFAFAGHCLLSCSEPPGAWQASLGGGSGPDFFSGNLPPGEILKKEKLGRASFFVAQMDSLNALMKESHDIQSLFQEAGLLSGSELSNDFILSLASPALLKKFAHEGENLFNRISALEKDSALSHDEKISRMSHVFESLARAVKSQSFFEYARQNISRELVLKAVRQSSSETAGDSARRSGRELYAIEKEEGSGKPRISGSLMIHAPAAPFIYEGQPHSERIFKEIQGYEAIISSLLRGKESLLGLGVNMYDSRQSFGLIHLADYVRESGLDIYVLGYCSLACSNYLLPAAENIYIEPYGLILYERGLLSFINRDISRPFDQAISRMRADFERRLTAEEESLAKRLQPGLISDLSIALKTRSGQAELFKKTDRILKKFPSPEKRKPAFLDLFGRLSQTEKNIVFDFLFEREGEVRRLRRISGHISSAADRESKLFDKVKFERGAAAGSSRPEYSYMDFLNAVHHLSSGDPFFESFFKNIESKSSADVPRGGPFHFIIPSTGLLKGLGLRIAGGENNSDNLYFDQSSPPPARMALDGEDIKSCGFFSGGGAASYRLERLKSCLKSPFQEGLTAD